MSLGLMSRERKFSEGQFVGDLANLLRRNRIESGDASGLERFESTLVSNDAFRSQLFTLCTAISHMGESDLSGEQLLDLIARALGTPGAGGSAIAGMSAVAQKAFLEGYDAWGRRGFEESKAWPPERPSVRKEVPAEPAREAADPAVAAGQETVPNGRRTIQEALNIARERAPVEEVASPEKGVNIEGLTLSELTKLLEEIERRMTKIKPQMNQLNAIARSPGAGLKQSARAKEPGDARAYAPFLKSSSVDSGPFLVRSGKSDEAMTFPGVDLGSSLGSGPASQIEDAFLARHAYMRPLQRRTVVESSAPVAVKPEVPPVVRRTPTAKGVAYKAQVIPDPETVPMMLLRRSELHPNLVLGIILLLLLIGIPLTAAVVYDSLHPRHQYRYFGLRPSAQSSESTAPVPAGVLPIRQL